MKYKSIHGAINGLSNFLIITPESWIQRLANLKGFPKFLRIKDQISTQQYFIERLVQALKRHTKSPQFLKDINLIQTEAANQSFNPTVKQPLEIIENAIWEELKQSRWWDFRYKQQLNLTLGAIQALRKNPVCSPSEKYNQFSQRSLQFEQKKAKSWEFNYKKKLRQADNLMEKRNHYQYSATQFGAEILPIQQGLDKGMGNEGGGCAGYVREWGDKMIKGQFPFGINPHDSFLFPPVKSRIPNLNHIIPISSEIYDKQNTQLFVKFERLAPVKFFFNPAMLTEHLLKLPSDNKVYQLNVLSCKGSGIGHALGFSQQQDGVIHFIDANYGWVRFRAPNSVSNFKCWFQDYFKLVYGQSFQKYEIFQLAQIPEDTPLSTLAFQEAKIRERASSLFYKMIDLPQIIINFPQIIINKLAVQSDLITYLLKKRRNKRSNDKVPHTLEESVPPLQTRVSTPDSLNLEQSKLIQALDLASNHPKQVQTSIKSACNTHALDLALPRQRSTDCHLDPVNPYRFFMDKTTSSLKGTVPGTEEVRHTYTTRL